MATQDDTTSWQASLKTAVNSLIDGLKDAATLTVETRTISPSDPNIAKDGFTGTLMAKTTIEVDGDSVASLPMLDEPGGQVNQPLLDLHNKNVDRALQYRTELLASTQKLIADLIDMLKNP